jgi:hypothetical protein
MPKPPSDLSSRPCRSKCELTLVLSVVEMALRFGNQAILSDPPHLVAADPHPVTRPAWTDFEFRISNLQI